MLDTLLVGTIVLIAAFFVGRRIYRQLTRPNAGCGCGCGGCGESSSCGSGQNGRDCTDLKDLR